MYLDKLIITYFIIIIIYYSGLYFKIYEIERKYCQFIKFLKYPNTNDYSNRFERTKFSTR